MIFSSRQKITQYNEDTRFFLNWPRNWVAFLVVGLP